MAECSEQTADDEESKEIPKEGRAVPAELLPLRREPRL